MTLSTTRSGLPPVMIVIKSLYKYKYLAKKTGPYFQQYTCAGISFLSGKEVERSNKGVKRVLGDTNQDNKLAIQFQNPALPRWWGSKCSRRRDGLARTQLSTLYIYILITLLPLCARTQTGHFVPRRCMLYGYVINFCNNFAKFKLKKMTFLAISPNLMPAKFSRYTV